MGAENDVTLETIVISKASGCKSPIEGQIEAF
jgi:hypothetical protein